MIHYEYKVLPAPQKGVKVKGAKTTEARFAHALMEIMNEMGRDGWEYQRTDTLPCQERVGLTGKRTQFQNMLVFRRQLPVEADAAPEITAVTEEFADEQPLSDEALDDVQPVEEDSRPDEAVNETAEANPPETGSRARGLVAQRLADTISGRGRSTAPTLRPVSGNGRSRPVDAANGNGVPRADGPDLAAE